MRVAIVQQLLSHYRGNVYGSLDESGRHQYVFFGAPEDPDEPDILKWQPPASADVRRLSISEVGPFRWHHGVVGIALARFDCLVLLGNAKYPAFWIAAIVARLRGKRVLMWTHGWIAEEPLLQRVVRNSFYRLANGLLLYGHIAKCIGLQYGFRGERLHVIYNSLDYRRQSVLRRSMDAGALTAIRVELFGDDAVPIVICSSRLHRARGLDQLIEAAAILQRRGHPVRLLIVGDGGERDALEAHAARRAVTAKFVGACYDEQRLALMTMASNVTVAPGKVGLTAMQSLAYGTPVVTHSDYRNQMPEFEAVVDGVSGSLFPRGDVEALADQIQRWTQRVGVEPAVRAACVRCIERRYTPEQQRFRIERAIEGQPADDLISMEPA